MSVLIKGMEMPISCGYCPLMHGTPNGDECYVGAHITEYQKTPDDCPLVPIPEHGDLIDLSSKVNAQYYDDAYEEWSIKTVTVEDILYGICEEMPPTIIPAEEGE